MPSATCIDRQPLSTDNHPARSDRLFQLISEAAQQGKAPSVWKADSTGFTDKGQRAGITTNYPQNRRCSDKSDATTAPQRE
ncbi:MAG TPA: hypothetical protein VIQ81_05060 [Gammaproteobacteria bacterium]